MPSFQRSLRRAVAAALRRCRAEAAARVDGQSVLERSVGLFLAHPADRRAGRRAAGGVRRRTAAVSDRATSKPIRIVTGGDRRQDSVLNAFQRGVGRGRADCDSRCGRPFASPELISRTIAAAAESVQRWRRMPARDTVKRATGALVRPATSSAKRCRARRSTWRRRRRCSAGASCATALALSEGGADATDEAALAERAGHAVRLVDGESDQHQDHDTRGPAGGRMRLLEASGATLAPTRRASARAMTCTAWSRGVR